MMSIKVLLMRMMTFPDQNDDPDDDDDDTGAINDAGRQR